MSRSRSHPLKSRLWEGDTPGSDDMLRRFEAAEVLRNVGDSPDGSLLSDRVSPGAAALARAALRPGRPAPGGS